jgi:excisionase family DNA binding protein
MAQKQQLDADHEYFTVKQTAAYLQVSERTIHTYIKTGRLEYSQPVRRGAIRISKTAIDNLMEGKKP